MSGDGFHQIRSKITKSFSMHNTFLQEIMFSHQKFCNLKQKACLCKQRVCLYLERCSFVSSLPQVYLRFTPTLPFLQNWKGESSGYIRRELDASGKLSLNMGNGKTTKSKHITFKKEKYGKIGTRQGSSRIV